MNYNLASKTFLRRYCCSSPTAIQFVKHKVLLIFKQCIRLSRESSKTKCVVGQVELKWRRATDIENSIVNLLLKNNFMRRLLRKYMDCEDTYLSVKHSVLLVEKTNNGGTTMQVSEFSSGLYTYKVIVDSNLELTGKLNIIK